mgnify:CR=1 FL=1
MRAMLAVERKEGGIVVCRLWTRNIRLRPFGLRRQSCQCCPGFHGLTTAPALCDNY